MPMTPTGYVPYTAAEMLQEIQQVFIDVLGSDVNLDPTLPIGQLIQELTNDALEVQEVQVLLYNGLYNPNKAPNVWLDAICAWLDLRRKPATRSEVTCQITGLSGTIIPINSQILNTNGDVFYNSEVITIGVGGTATGIFLSQSYGPVSCDAGTLTRIVQQVSGWDTVNNSGNGILGTLKQTDTSLRNTRKNALALNASGSYPAIISACAANESITSFLLEENYSSATVTKRGVLLQPHAIYLSIYGTITDGEVAAILSQKMSNGCGMQGNTTVTYIDPNYSWVEIDYIFQRAVDAPVQINITAADSSSYPDDIEDQIKAAVVANFNGEVEGIPAIGIGDTIYATRFYQPVTSTGVYAISSITVGEVGGPYTASLTLGMDKMPTITEDDVVVTLT